MIHVQISSGRGPSECRLAILNIRRKMLAEGPGAKLVHWHTETYANSCVISFEGDAAEEYARSWEGTILWVCQNPLGNVHGTRNGSPRKRKNWYVGVKRIDVPVQAKIELKDSDLLVETMRASGKGGQHVNKTETKVRLTHIPTGIVVVSEHQRSQKQNLETAKSILVGKLKEREDNIFAALDTVNWSQHNTLERGNPKRTFHGTDFTERNS